MYVHIKHKILNCISVTNLPEIIGLVSGGRWGGNVGQTVVVVELDAGGAVGGRRRGDHLLIVTNISCRCVEFLFRSLMRF